MAELNSYRCHNCNMVFRSYPLLEKHRDKFCIGSHVGDSTVRSSRFVDTGENMSLHSRSVPRMAETPTFRMRDSIAQLRARENLLNEREQQLMGGYGQSGMVSDSIALKSLTDEFHKLRKSLEDTVPTMRSFQFQGEFNPHNQWDREYRERMQEMAQAHERHLADIQSRNQTLELQREEIKQRLSDFASSGSSTSHIEQMLLELKAQEEKNQLALDALRDQVGLIQSESRAKAEREPPPNTAAKPEKMSLNLLTIPVHGSSLSSEISALQLAYIQSGGNDPSVLAQMKELQTEAMMFEDMAHRQDRKERKKRRHDGAPRVLDVELMTVEMENQRLEEELFNLKLRGKKKDNGDSEMAEMHKEHLQQMAQLQADIEMLRRDVTRIPPRAVHGPPPFIPPPVAPPAPPPMHPARLPPGRPDASFMMGGVDSMRPHSGSRHILDPPDALGPAPYDPVAGFVIFYDFLLGLEPTFQKVRLLSGLYSNGHRMGQTTSLPDVPCEIWHSPQHLANTPRGNIAMLSAKQPIPRVRPGSSIALVMELQAAGGFNPYGQEVQRLSSCGWTKLDLFDQHNQVLSGRWKLPVRALPLRAGLSTGQLNTVPQVGKAELFLRVVNARDADIQSMAEIDPRNASLYQYPLLMSGPAAPMMENPGPSSTFYQPPSSLNLSLSPYTDYVDPPPVEELSNLQSSNKMEEVIRMELEAERKTTVGFLIDRVKGAPLGDGTIRLTGYHMKTGQVIRTRGSGMTYVISAVSSSIKHRYFVFGEQEVTFSDVTPEEDMVLMLRFYHWPGGSAASAPWQHRQSLEPLLATEEWATAWTALRLTKPTDSADTDDKVFEWNTGIHDLPLYHVPAPEALKLSALCSWGPAGYLLVLLGTSRLPSTAPGDRLVTFQCSRGPAGYLLVLLVTSRLPSSDPGDQQVTFYCSWGPAGYLLLLLGTSRLPSSAPGDRLVTFYCSWGPAAGYLLLLLGTSRLPSSAPGDRLVTFYCSWGPAGYLLVLLGTVLLGTSRLPSSAPGDRLVTFYCSWGPSGYLLLLLGTSRLPSSDPGDQQCSRGPAGYLLVILGTSRLPFTAPGDQQVTFYCSWGPAGYLLLLLGTSRLPSSAPGDRLVTFYCSWGPSGYLLLLLGTSRLPSSAPGDRLCSWGPAGYLLVLLGTSRLPSSDPGDQQVTFYCSWGPAGYLLLLLGTSRLPSSAPGDRLVTFYCSWGPAGYLLVLLGTGWLPSSAPGDQQLPESYVDVFEQYDSAMVRLCVFSTSVPDLLFLPETPMIESSMQEAPDDVYISHSRTSPPSQPFSSTDNIDLYIDGARFLPDAVTVTRVTGRIFDKTYDQIGPDIATGIDINSDIFHPIYNYSVQIRVPNIPPTATLLLKLYTVDRFTRELALIGWAALNLFVESGTQKAPTSDSRDVKISLNEGAFQIRLYHQAPPTDQPFSADSLTSTGCIVPCATMLVRVMKAEANKNEEIQPIQELPEYSQGVYYSDSARPTQGEMHLYKAMRNRSVVLVRDVIPLLVGAAGHQLLSNEQMSTWIQKTFSGQMNSSPQPFQLCCVSRYLITSGVKVSADRAHNLPWSGFTLAHMCFNPPAAYYFGEPWSKFDHPVLVEDIDLSSYQKSPVWQDGFKSFTRRIYHEHLTVIFQLHEILQSQIAKDGNQHIESNHDAVGSYTLQHGAEAWAALKVFYMNYCNMGVYQLPLYRGVPSQAVLAALEAQDCVMTLKELEGNKMIQLVPGASLIVRIADGRRDEELKFFTLQDINQSYLPKNAIEAYNKEPSGPKISELIPSTQKEEDFKNQLANWIRKYISQNPRASHQEPSIEEEVTPRRSDVTIHKQVEISLTNTAKMSQESN
ncbi:coiled-coil domain-containing protein 17 [Discoglossus pictus]